ncbi:hypothetical protein [Pseudomonas syringae]
MAVLDSMSTGSAPPTNHSISRERKGTPISRSRVKVKSHRTLQFSTAGFALQLNLIG